MRQLAKVREEYEHDQLAKKSKHVWRFRYIETILEREFKLAIKEGWLSMMNRMMAEHHPSHLIPGYVHYMVLLLLSIISKVEMSKIANLYYSHTPHTHTKHLVV